MHAYKDVLVESMQQYIFLFFYFFMFKVYWQYIGNHLPLTINIYMYS